MLELAQRIILLTGSTSAIAHGETPPSEPLLEQPDFAPARSALGWMPRIPLEEGLKQTIDYFRWLQENPESLDT
jgi:nucleoside-diphosphate-sugar epimerase